MTVISVPFHLDEALPGFVPPVEPEVVVAPDLPSGTTWERMAVLYDAVAAAVATARTPVVVSGDRTTSMGVIAGLQRGGVDPALVWFDAHGDVQTPETSASGGAGARAARPRDHRRVTDIFCYLGCGGGHHDRHPYP